MKKYHLLPFMFLALLASCTSLSEELPEEPVYTEGSSVSFNASFKRGSRATETAFERGDAISVFAVDPEAGTELKSSGNYADNIKYTYQGGTFEAGNDAVTIGTDQTEGLAYYAVYPYQASASDKFSFAVKANQSTHSNYTLSDLCTSYVSPTAENTVDLEFNHRLCNMVVKFQGDNLASKNIKVQLEGVYTGCTVDLNTSICQPAGSKGNVIMCKESDNSFQAIIIPQTLTAESGFITVTLDNQDYCFKLPANKTIKSGCAYSYTFRMDGNVVTAVSGGLGSLEDAEEGYNDGVVTIVEAGTMKKLLGNDYLNITSLKVIGPINGDDVYYLRKMLGGSEFDQTDWGKLTTLDLSEARIVEGGGWYHEDFNSVYHYFM